MIVSSGSGYVALLLHAHLPYVRQEQEKLTLEERWFYEAVTDTYIPLLDLLDRLAADGVDFRLTLSLSPTLLAMMEDPVMQRRTRQHIASLRELAQKEVLRLWGDADYIATAIHYAERYSALDALYDRWGGDLIARLRRLQELGCVELIPCAATHAFLPLVKNAEALRAQLEAAVTEFRRHFGRTPAGIWLPECGYTPAVEPHLQALGLRYFVVDAHTVGHAATAGAKAYSGAPVRTAGGAAAFARDPEASTQVWSAESGYPSDPEYREYYRDIGFDLGHGSEAEWLYIKPYVLPDGERIHTGLKYHRVTGRTDAKEPYRPELAALKAQQHAEHFLAARAEQLQRLATEASQPAIIVCPYDAELFGHWWYEGIQWLETVLRGLDRSNKQSISTVSTLHSTTLSDYLTLYPPTAEAKLPESSWGRGGYADVWLQPATDWIYPRLHEAEDRMIRIAQRHSDPAVLSNIQFRLLNQAARELMLAQASDWAFILDANTVTEYAQHRIQDHLHQFHQLVDFIDGSSDLLQKESTFQFLEQAERRMPIFPSVSYTIYQPLSSIQAFNYPTPLKQEPKQVHQQLRILMLAWEYPPRIIGGLSRAVCDLSRHLAMSGHQIHVITCAVPELPAYEFMEGVHVHRIHVLQSLTPVDFFDWVFQMNLAFTDYIVTLADQGMAFDLIHAHDWLVYYSASQSKQALRIPLIATIHATESGRNQGALHSDLQLRIHGLEHKLTAAADRIITCSHSMTVEVSNLFDLPSNKILTISNGVDFTQYPTIHQLLPTKPLQEALQHTQQERVLCFMGRLVQEKGIHILIEAMSLVLPTHPSAKLLIAGVGPMMDQLTEQAAPLGDRIQFVGFLNETDKTILLHHAELCIFPSLYEPFGIVALEAMSRYTPVIVSDVGGLGEIIEHGIDGCKVTPGDAIILAEQIAALLNEPEYGKQLAASAASKVKLSYNWTSIGADTAKAYYELTKKSS